MGTFIVIDKNRLLSKIYKTNSWENAVDAILTLINEHLNFLINNDIKLDLNKLSFDNYQIVSRIDNSKNLNLFRNSYKLNLKEMKFKDIFDGIHEIPEVCNYNKNNIKLNLKNLTNKSENNLEKKINVKNTKIIPKQEDPIKKLFNETSEIIKNLDSKRHIIQNETMIPIISDSDSEMDNKENDIKNENNEYKIKEPNIRRQFDSIILEKSENTIKEKDVINDCNEIDTEELEKTIEALNLIKEQEQKKLEEIKQQNEKDMENFSKYNNKLGDKRRENRQNKEREQERRRIFEADKVAYIKMKQHINE